MLVKTVWVLASTWPESGFVAWYQPYDCHHPMSPQAQPQTTTEELAVSEVLGLDQHTPAAPTHSYLKGKEMFQQCGLALCRDRESEWLLLIAISSSDLRLIRHMSDHYQFDWTTAEKCNHRCLSLKISLFHHPFPHNSALNFFMKIFHFSIALWSRTLHLVAHSWKILHWSKTHQKKTKIQEKIYPVISTAHRLFSYAKNSETALCCELILLNKKRARVIRPNVVNNNPTEYCSITRFRKAVLLSVLIIC